ncbi:MAG: glycosyltransferase family 2 protein [bacterium]|nr:glycosyltransferase family 2 protein [bacterium]
MEKDIKISAIVPVFNEDESIIMALSGLKQELLKLRGEKKVEDFEIIVINDASTDMTRGKLNGIANIKIIDHLYNKGYGASLKTGARNAQFDWLLFYDGDGQHKPEYIEELIKYVSENEMVVGSREGYRGSVLRQLGKKLLTWIANYLVEKKIPDINSGFRLVKKDIFLKFSGILPNSFSASTTITLAFYKDGYNIKFIPITINSRQKGKSTVKPKHAFTMSLLILRVIMLFNPLKIFMPMALILFVFSVILILLDIISQGHISNSTGTIFLTTVIVFVLGLLADQISNIRRETK